MLTNKFNLIRPTGQCLLRTQNVLFRSKLNKATTIKLSELDPEIDQAIKSGTHYKRVKAFRPKIEQFVPAYLELVAEKLIQEKKDSQFRGHVDQMIARIFHSQLPPEDKEIQLYAKEIEAKFVAREKSNLEEYEELSEDQKLEKLIERNKKIETNVRKKIFSWKEYDWNEYQSIVYMAARLAPNYMSTRFVFNDIKHIDPEFKPKSLFDFGSGLGTTMHVANEMWPASIHEHVNIDKSREMIDLCDLILKNGNDKNPQMFNNVFYKQFLPVGRHATYDLVVSAFSLKELPNVNARINVIETLWHKTSDILVFIEHGNQAGTAAILEARSFILKMNGYDPVAIYSSQEETGLEKGTVNPDVHIMTPCPHHYVCPRLNKEYGVWCNFEVNYFPIHYSQPAYQLRRERISYVVFRKKAKSYRYFPAWPRVVQSVKKSGKLVNLKLCTPNGQIENLSVSKGKNDRNAYDCARACKWGDNFPCKIKEVGKWEHKMDRNAKYFFRHNTKPPTADEVDQFTNSSPQHETLSDDSKRSTKSEISEQ